ncbi:histidine phosphatase family protein [Cryptosporangium phraense]|uniref:Histidine phosphatase family protein n=1 Tax=Cryptosporangium phraense TaxID=2593070 RepID=A0A545AE91_9ACTN|nr:histidine phosphatase family protein [Cryptosporangium phraense]TQS39580.1 histidine phosphatase family protein [Cryptosporangium phraense]
MTAGRVLIWRHGRTEWNATGRIQGQTDVPLDATGVQQALQAAPLLAAEEPDAIVSSDLQRAKRTADALGELTGLPVAVDVRLRETGFGPWEGLSHTELEERWPAEYAVWKRGETPEVPGIERPADVVARMGAAVSDALAAVDGTLVVVCHGGAARRAVQALTGWPDEVAAQVSALGNCRWTELRLSSTRGWRLHAHNVGPMTGVAANDEPSTAADAEPATDEELTSSPTSR